MKGGIKMLPRLNVMGVGVSAINMDDALGTIAAWVERGERRYVCALNAHSIVEASSDPSLRRIHNEAGLATPDGMPLVWLLKGAGYKAAERHFLFGSTPATLQRLEANLTKRYPGLCLVGSYSPPFRALDPVEEETAIEMINRSGAQIVWVGLGAPKQERWMAVNRSRLSANVLIGVGAAFDFHAGVVKQAPMALQRSGLEWLHRLYVEPRRLWRRYLRTNPRFVAGVIMQKTRLRAFEIDA
jgi:N-acetylglucosaminyldiphosphoundecaprenol N-acetyl-beta-D-mannosaminyltransferase